MAIFYFPCPFCQKEVKADTDWIGESCDCPYCDYSFLIPPMPGMEKKKTFLKNNSNKNESISFTMQCPRCQKEVKADTKQIGQSCKCPYCDCSFLIPTVKQKISDFFLTLGMIALVVWAIAGLIGLYFADTGIERAVWIAPWVIFIFSVIINSRDNDVILGGIVFCAITVGILLWFSSCCSSCRETSIKVLNEQMESEQNGHKANAWHYATVFVKKRLKAPSTADFEKKYVRNNGNVWEVGGFVDAQNGFGAKLRNGFYCKLEYNNKTWTEISTVIFE